MVLRRFFHKKRQRDSCGEFRNLERDFHYSSFRTFGLTQKYQKVKHGEKPQVSPPAFAERARKIRPFAHARSGRTRRCCRCLRSFLSAIVQIGRFATMIGNKSPKLREAH